MKFLLGLFLIFLISCGVPGNNTESMSSPPITSLQTFIDTFYRKHSNFGQNDVVDKEINRIFKKSLVEEINKGLLDNYPLTLKGVNEYSKNKFSAHFSNYISESPIKNHIVNFDVIGLISPEIARSLIQEKQYFITGKFKNFLGLEYSDYVNGMAYTDNIGMKKESYGSPEFQLGIILMNVTEIK